jgi:hypothetical protein
VANDWKQKYDTLVEEIRNVDTDMGIYPQAVKGYNDERDYTQRDGFKNGWNAAIINYGCAINKIGYSAEKSMSDDLAMLISANVGEWTNGVFELDMSDTWAWATAWSEEVEEVEIPVVAKLFRRYGQAGLYYWMTTKNPELKSEFHDINRSVDFVREEEKLIAEEPSSTKRAYKKLSYKVGI